MMVIASLTSQIEVHPWPLPRAVAVQGGFVRCQWWAPPSSAGRVVKAAQRIREQQQKLVELRRSLVLLRGQRDRGSKGVGPRIDQCRSQVRPVLGELKEARRKRKAPAAAFSEKLTRRGRKIVRHALTSQDDARIRRLAEADDADHADLAMALLRVSGPLTLVRAWPANSVPLSLVVALARHYTATQDLIDALRRDVLDRAQIVGAARCLEVVGRAAELPDLARFADGLTRAKDYARRHARLGDHAREVVSRSVTAWVRLFCGAPTATWAGDRLSLATGNGLGAALALSLVRQANGSEDRFRCEGCGRPFNYGKKDRRPREGAPVYCPTCRSNNTSRDRSDRRERIVQKIQTRLDAGRPKAEILADVAGELARGDDFGELLTRARKRRKRR